MALALDKVIQSVGEIADLHRKYHGRVKKSSKLIKPGVKSDFCTLDRRCDDLLIRFFGKRGMGFNLVTEESAFKDNGSDYTLYGDGLDGTAWYLMGKKYSCVSVGIAYKGELIAGVVMNGLTGDLYFAEKGSGAFKREQNNPGVTQSLRTKHSKGLETCAVAIPTFEDLLDTIDKREIVYSILTNSWKVSVEGSIALNLCELAEGITDIVLTGNVGGPWDYAAGAVILKESKGHIGNWQKGKYDMNKPTPMLAASSHKLYEKFFEKYLGSRK